MRGRVLPIGGLKEKLLAAHRGGIKTVLIPEENAKDLVEINDSIKSGLDIIPVSRMDEVLARALSAQARADRLGGGERRSLSTSPSRSWRKIPPALPRTERRIDNICRRRPPGAAFLFAALPCRPARR